MLCQMASVVCVFHSGVFLGACILFSLLTAGDFVVVVVLFCFVFDKGLLFKLCKELLKLNNTGSAGSGSKSMPLLILGL